jgi:hypothetical protein
MGFFFQKDILTIKPDVVHIHVYILHWHFSKEFADQPLMSLKSRLAVSGTDHLNTVEEKKETTVLFA